MNSEEEVKDKMVYRSYEHTKVKNLLIIILLCLNYVRGHKKHGQPAVGRNLVFLRLLKQIVNMIELNDESQIAEFGETSCFTMQTEHSFG